MEKNNIVSLKISELEKRALDRLAERDGVNRSEYLRELLKDKIFSLMTSKGLSYVIALKKIAKGEE